MKLTSKIVTLVAATLMIVHVACPTEQQIVAYKAKGMNLGQNSAIQIWQGTNIVSAATFSTATNKKGNSLTPTVLFPKDKKSLFFTKGIPVTIAYNFYGSEKNPGQAPDDSLGILQAKPFKTQKTFQPAEMPEKSKIKVSIGGGGTAHAHPFNIDIEPLLVRVNVNKDAMKGLTGKTKIIALKESISDTEMKPHPKLIYDTIEARFTSVKKLSVPYGKKFWIAVPISKSLNAISEMAATEVKKNSVITINDLGNASFTTK